MTQVLGELFAIITALCGAASSVIYNRMGKRTGADILAYVRMCIAAPIMLVYGLVADGNALFTADTIEIVKLFISGVIGFFVTDLFLFRGYVEWGARETMVVMCLSPVLSGIVAFLFFKESMTLNQLIGSICSISGVFIMTTGGRKTGKIILSLGFTYALLAAVFQSASDISAKIGLSQIPWVTAAAIRAVGGMCAWIIFGFFKGKSFFNNIEDVKQPRFFSLLVVNVLIGTVLGTSFAMGALKSAPAGVVTSLKQMSPVFILPYEVLVQKKKLSFTDVFGTLISVFGVFLLF